jgi:hypothetical protein
MKTRHLSSPAKGSRLFLLTALPFLCALFLFPATTFAAGKKADFTGTWTLNESKSTIGEGRFRLSTMIVAKQDGINLELERTRTGRDGQPVTQTEKLTLDGKEILSEGENRTTKTTAAWSEDGKSLIISSTMTFTREGQTTEVKSQETWNLSDDGKTLTIQYHSSSPRGERNDVLVYDKKTN